MNRHEKKFRQFVQKMDKKNKNKNNSYCKALCVNTQTQKFAKIFETISILIKFIELISRIA